MMEHCRMILLMIFLSSNVVAQRRLILGSELAVPYNSLKASASSGIGITTKYDRFVSSHFALTLSVDFVSFGKVYGLNPGGKIVEPSSKVQTLSEQLGGKYYLRKRIEPKGFYLSAEAGLHTSWLKNYDAGKLYQSIDQTNFGYRYGFGLSGRHFDYSIVWQNFYQRDYEIAQVFGSRFQNKPLRYWCLRVSYIFPD